jgi:hypothetical protein
MRLGPCSLCSWIHYLIVESILVLNFAEPALKISLWFFSLILFVDNMWFLSRRGVLRTLFLFRFFSWGVGLLGVRYHGWRGVWVAGIYACGASGRLVVLLPGEHDVEDLFPYSSSFIVLPGFAVSSCGAGITWIPYCCVILWLFKSVSFLCWLFLFIPLVVCEFMLIVSM